MPMSAEVRTLDSGYDRETRSLLYHAYRHEPTFAYLFEADRPGYQQRVRATVRELVNQHFLQQQPALGLLLDDRLIAVALIAPPQRRLDVTESWAWRSEEHTSELQSIMRTSYAVFCLQNTTRHKQT